MKQYCASSRMEQGTGRQAAGMLLHRLQPLLLLILLLLPGQVRATLPDPVSVYVNDFAQVLSEEDSAELTTMIQALRQDHGTEVAVVTIRSRSDLGDWPDMAGLGKALFNAWGIGHASRNDGVLLLLAVDDHEVRVTLGSGYPPVWDGRALRVIDVFMLPLFSESDFAGGLKAGLHGLEDYLIRPFTEGTAYEDSRDPPGIWGGHAWLDFLLFVGFCALGASLLLWEARHRLGDLLAVRRPCPQCGGRGVVVIDTAAAGTAGAAGPHQISRVCPSCGWHQDREAPAPDTTHEDGSGGSDSFGGGHSSGGGAGGRW